MQNREGLKKRRLATTMAVVFLAASVLGPKPGNEWSTRVLRPPSDAVRRSME